MGEWRVRIRAAALQPSKAGDDDGSEEAAKARVEKKWAVGFAFAFAIAVAGSWAMRQ